MLQKNVRFGIFTRWRGGRRSGDVGFDDARGRLDARRADARAACLAVRRGRVRASSVAMGEPTRPPQTMPAIAAATATVAAPATPACSKSGANARPGRRTAGQRYRTGEHAEQRRLAERSATPAPTTFWRTATAVAKRKKRSTSGPPSLQKLIAGAEADRGEERVLKRRLERRVESHELQAATVRDGHRDGDDETADNRRWHVEARRAPGRRAAGRSRRRDDAGDCDGVDEIERKHRVEADGFGQPTRQGGRLSQSR